MFFILEQKCTENKSDKKRKEKKNNKNNNKRDNLAHLQRPSASFSAPAAKSCWAMGLLPPPWTRPSVRGWAGAGAAEIVVPPCGVGAQRWPRRGMAGCLGWLFFFAHPLPRFAWASPWEFGAAPNHPPVESDLWRATSWHCALKIWGIPGSAVSPPGGGGAGSTCSTPPLPAFFFVGPGTVSVNNPPCPAL